MQHCKTGSVRQLGIEVVLVAVVFMTLYGCTLSQNLSISHDSIHYIQTIDDGRNPFHPHHLLYVPFMRSWVQSWRSCGVAMDSVRLVELLNSLFGAITIATVYLCFRRGLGVRRRRAFAGCLLIGTSFGFWYYSVCVEVYVIPVCFLMATCCLLTLTRRGLWVCGAAGVAWGLAILFHQTHVLFAPAVLVGLLLGRDASLRRRLFRVAICFVVAILVVGVPYGYVSILSLEHASAAEMAHWLTGYAGQSQWGHFEWVTVPKTLIGIGRCIVGGHFVVSIPSVASLADGVFENHLLQDERFLVRGLSTGMAWALLAAAFVSIAMVLVLVFRGRRCGKEGLTGAASPHAAGSATAGLAFVVTRRVRCVAWAWLIVYSAFFCWWEPTNLEFWIAPLLSFWILFVAYAGHCNRGWVGVGLAALLLGLTNYVGSIRFLQDSENDWYYQQTRFLAGTSRSHDLIIAGRRWIWGDYLEYFTPADVWCLTDRHRWPEGEAGLHRSIARRLEAGHRVFVTEDAVEAEIVPVFPDGEIAVSAGDLWLPYQLRWCRIDSPFGACFVITPQFETGP